MRGFGRRLLHLLGVLFLVSFLTMLLADVAPGDPAISVLGDTATQEQIDIIHHQLGLDDPIPVRYVKWVNKALHGDLGRSLITREPVWKSVRERIPVNAELVVAAMLIALVIAIPAGVYSANRPEGWFDRGAAAVGSVLLSSPPFLTPLFLVFAFALHLKWLPVTGWVPLTQDVGENLRHIAQPVIAIAITEMAIFSRLLRGDMVQTLEEDFVLAARARGLKGTHILFRHALRPSAFSLVTSASLTTARLVGGSLILEQIYALPGLGQLVVRAIDGKDIVVVQGVVLVVAVLYVLMNIASTLLYAWLDPRIRGARAGA